MRNIYTIILSILVLILIVLQVTEMKKWSVLQDLQAYYFSQNRSVVGTNKSSESLFTSVESTANQQYADEIISAVDDDKTLAEIDFFNRNFAVGTEFYACDDDKFTAILAIDPNNDGVIDAYDLSNAYSSASDRYNFVNYYSADETPLTENAIGFVTSMLRFQNGTGQVLDVHNDGVIEYTANSKKIKCAFYYNI